VTPSDLASVRCCLQSWYMTIPYSRSDNTQNALDTLKTKTIAVQQEKEEKERQEKEWQEKVKEASSKVEKKGKRPIDRPQHHFVESRLKRDR
jgi:hypothetical protein